MNKMLVVVFDDEASAYEGRRTLQRLAYEGSVELYADAVIANEGGKIVTKSTFDDGMENTALGMLLGGLVGMFGGPAGFAVGVTAGTLTGGIVDLSKAGVDAEFLDDIADELDQGKFALFAEIYEEWITPIDNEMENLDGIVLRKVRSEVVDEQIERRLNDLKEEHRNLRDEWAHATDETKSKLKVKLDESKFRLEQATENAKLRIDSMDREARFKIDSLNQKIKEAKREQKEKFESRMDHIKSDYHMRVEKLKKAWEKTKSSLHS